MRDILYETDYTDVHTYIRSANEPRTRNKGICSHPAAQCIEKKRKGMQLHTSRLLSQKCKNPKFAGWGPPIYIWIGAFVPPRTYYVVRPYLLAPANELRIAGQAIGDKIHDVFMGSLMHEGLQYIV